MDVYRKYFKVESGPLFDAVNEARAINAAANEKYKELLEKVGATQQYYQVGNQLTAMTFNEEPDNTLFKRIKRCNGGWYPKKNSKKAKAIADEFEAVNTVDEQDCLSVVGVGGFARIFCASRAHRSTLTVIPSDPIVVFVSVPWYDIDPKELEEYKANENYRSQNIDAIMWEAPVEMVPIKKWEIDRAVDEWNESC